MPLFKQSPSQVVLRIVIALVAAFAAGCGADTSRPAPRARQPETLITRDVPSVLRDTIGAQTGLSGAEPILVSGYGLVVGLNNTGSGDIPGPIRAIMEREMSLMGIGRELGGAFKDITPGELLSDRRTAVVLVTAAVPPGSPAGTKFDVRIDALPGTATTSLEGGTLYTTKLYQGLIRPAAPATQAIAQAKGPLFLNPYADPAMAGQDTVYRTVARVLDGGIVMKPGRVMLTLDAPSHSRVRAMVDAINTRFPRPRAESDVARGMNEELIEISIPPVYRAEPAEFLQVLSRIRVDQSFPEEAARRYVAALKDQPELAEPLSRCLQALGTKAIPFVREMYAFGELRPRMAAIEAGARLGDMTVQPYLQELVLTGAPGARTRAVRLMGELGIDPEINVFLREMLDDPEIDMRLAAYDTLAKRNDPIIDRRRMGGKFVVDIVPSATPMVYATLQREPKVVIFGGDVEIRRPCFASAWNDRMMVSADSDASPVRAFYRDYRTGKTFVGEIRPLLFELVEYMAHKTTPEEPAPGLDLSYSEVVGSLAILLRKGIAPAQFIPESDKLELELLRLRQTEQDLERPEFPGDLPDAIGPASPDGTKGQPPAGERPEGAEAGPTQPAEPAAPPKQRYVVPLGPPPGQQADPAEDESKPK